MKMIILTCSHHMESYVIDYTENGISYWRWLSKLWGLCISDDYLMKIHCMCMRLEKVFMYIIVHICHGNFSVKKKSRMSKFRCKDYTWVQRIKTWCGIC